MKLKGGTYNMNNAKTASKADTLQNLSKEPETQAMINKEYKYNGVQWDEIAEEALVRGAEKGLELIREREQREKNTKK
jgi:hypothetical protein